MKSLILVTFLAVTSVAHSIEHWKSVKSSDGKAVLNEMIHEDGETSAFLHFEGKAAEELFNLLSKNRHAAKVQNKGLDEVWLGENISCIKYLQEKRKIVCTQEIFKSSILK